MHMMLCTPDSIFIICSTDQHEILYTHCQDMNECNMNDNEPILKYAI